MRTKPLGYRGPAVLAVLSLLAGAGCKQELGSFAFVTVSLSAEAAGLAVHQIRSRARNGDASESEAFFPETRSGQLSFAPSMTYLIELGARTGTLNLEVEALGADGMVLARGFRGVSINLKGQTNIPITLGVACTTGSDCTLLDSCDSACLDENDLPLANAEGEGRCEGGTPPPDGTPCYTSGIEAKVCLTGACSASVCGDGQADARLGEECDLGAGKNTESSACPSCRAATCGDGHVFIGGGEECDEGDANSNAPDAACRRGSDVAQGGCLRRRCGDGIIDAAHGEGCDDGALNGEAPNVACRSDCQPGRCGDGIVDDGEVCDDFTQPVPGSGCVDPAADEALGCRRRLGAAAARFSVQGAAAGHKLGWSSTVGRLRDTAGAAADDLVVSAREVAGNVGEVYVLFGGAGRQGALVLNSARTNVDVKVTGLPAWYLGDVVATAKLDGDDYDDLVITSVNTSTVYVIYGPFPAGVRTDITLDAAGATGAPHGATVIRAPVEYRLGVALAAGDVTGDGRADLAISAVQIDRFIDGDGGIAVTDAGAVVAADDAGVTGGGVYCPPPGPAGVLRDDAGVLFCRDTGGVFVLPGGSALFAPGVIDLAARPDEVRLVVGPELAGYAGSALAVANVSGEASGDLVIGATIATPGAAVKAGAVYVVNGPIMADRDLQRVPPEVTILGAAQNELLGASLAAADLDGDAHADLVIGAPGGHRVYVLAGPLGTGSHDLAAGAYSLLVSNGGAELGRVVAVGDVNGDGRVDLFASAPGASAGAGVVVGLLGQPGFFATKTLDLQGSPESSPAADIVVSGANPGDRLGWSLVTGDVTAADLSGIIVGAHGVSSGAGQATCFIGMK